ncbi:hypothetical protein ACI2L1_38420 [Streptomyces sp. NPDC019531]|uniref:hypothetical protein n=1 Tax=Streptomyces sp. NPDC019531 TaxID=3365062 RepID=UPI00384F1BAE
MHIHAAEHQELTRFSLQWRGITPIRVLHETGMSDAGALIAHGRGVEEDLPLPAEHAAMTAVVSYPEVYLKHALRPPLQHFLHLVITVRS